MHLDEGTEPVAVLLKSPDFTERRGPSGELPYRVDLLRRCGLRLAWSDDHLDAGRSRLLGALEQRTVPFRQALNTRKVRRDAAVTVAFFESEAHGLALWRRLSGRRNPPLMVIACWLADLARSGSASQRRLYRWLYGAVDALVVFSSNQVETLVELLEVPRERIHVVPFGVDLDELLPVPTVDGGGVVAIGRDLSRDWATLCTAATGSGWSVDLATRPRQLRGLQVPPEVSFRGRLPRGEYLALLASASVVVIPTEVREYPAGQTVLLEAMAMGKACVMTDTPGIRDYVVDGEDAVLVPAHDPAALRLAIDRLLDDPQFRSRIGRAARARAISSGGAAAMWSSIGRHLAGVGPG